MRPALCILLGTLLATRMLAADAVSEPTVTPNTVAAYDPPAARAWLEVGLIRRDFGDNSGARADFERAIACDPGLAAARMMLGLCKEGAGDLDGAIADHTEAIRLDPGLASAHLNRGRALAAKGDPAAALNDYDRALALDDRDRRFRTHRGLAHLALGNVIGALLDFNAAGGQAATVSARGAAGGGRSPAPNQRGQGALAQRGAGAPGGGFGPPAGPVTSDNFNGIFNRAAVRLIQGDLAEALTDTEAAITVAPNARADASFAHINRALLRARLQQEQPMAGLAREAAGWKPGWAQTVARFVLGEVPEAEFLSAATVPADRAREAEAFYYAAVVRQLAGDIAAARTLYGKCLAAAPRSATATVVRAELARLPGAAPVTSAPALPLPPPPDTAATAGRLRAFQQAASALLGRHASVRVADQRRRNEARARGVFYDPPAAADQPPPFDERELANTVAQLLTYNQTNLDKVITEVLAVNDGDPAVPQTAAALRAALQTERAARLAHGHAEVDALLEKAGRACLAAETPADLDAVLRSLQPYEFTNGGTSYSTSRSPDRETMQRATQGRRFVALWQDYLALRPQNNPVAVRDTLLEMLPLADLVLVPRSRIRALQAENNARLPANPPAPRRGAAARGGS